MSAENDGPESEEEDPPLNQHKYGVSAVSQLQIKMESMLISVKSR